jgi:5'-3' exonuclease
MAGCEYLQNIERVGLKVALKLFEKHKTFEKVIGALVKNPIL